jgi:hypothetical protein
VVGGRRHGSTGIKGKRDSSVGTDNLPFFAPGASDPKPCDSDGSPQEAGSVGFASTLG